MRLDGLAAAPDEGDGRRGILGWALARLPEKDRRPAGFSLLAAGCLAGLIGLAAILFAQSADGMMRYTYREVAGASLALALMLVLAGGALSLPMSRASQGAGALGFAVAAAGVVSFVVVYPYLWNTDRDWSSLAIVVYGLGLALLVASLASGLVSAYVEARERRSLEGRRDDVSEEEVMRDILDTTSRSRLTWGGVRTDDRALELSPDSYASSARILGGGFERLGLVSAVAADELNQEVDALLTFRGVKDQATDEYDETTVAALQRLRAEQEAARNATWHARLFSMFKSGNR